MTAVKVKIKTDALPAPLEVPVFDLEGAVSGLRAVLPNTTDERIRSALVSVRAVAGTHAHDPSCVLGNSKFDSCMGLARSLETQLTCKAEQAVALMQAGGLLLPVEVQLLLAHL